MSHSTRSRRRRRTRTEPWRPGQPLATPGEALRVVLAAVSQPAAPETIVLLLDQQHRGGVCMIVRDAVTADQVVSLVPVLRETVASGTSLGAVVLATSRPGMGIAPTPADEETFATLRHDLSPVGVDVLDWFLLDDRLIASVAELVGASWRWQGEEPSW